MPPGYGRHLFLLRKNTGKLRGSKCSFCTDIGQQTLQFTEWYNLVFIGVSDGKTKGILWE